MTIGIAIVQVAGPSATRDLLEWLSREAPAGHIQVLSDGTVPARRARAVRGTDAAALLLVEDTVRPAGGWWSAACEAMSEPMSGADAVTVAASGPIRCPDTLPTRVRAWAAHEYALDDGTGDRPVLPGHLLLLRLGPARDALAGDDGLREDTFFARLEGRRRLLHGLASQIVAADPRGASLGGQFRHGRGWAGRQSWSRPVRAVRVAAWPAVAAVRASRSLDPRQPLAVRTRISALATAWALGETAGALLGAGDEAHWR